MNYILDIFLFGTLGFWLFWGLATVAIIYSLEQEEYIMGNILMIVGLLLVYHSFAGVVTWSAVLTYLGLYFLSGAFWSLFKWWRHCRQAADEFNEAVEQHPSGYDSYRLKANNAMTASYNKGLISAWIAYWPWSFLWSISRDVVNTVFDALTGLYNGISNNARNRLTPPPVNPTLTKDT